MNSSKERLDSAQRRLEAARLLHRREFAVDAMSRLYMLEHPLTMIIAVVLITVGYSRTKKLEDNRKKFFSIWLFYLIGLALILLRIPWSEWPV